MIRRPRPRHVAGTIAGLAAALALAACSAGSSESPTTPAGTATTSATSSSAAATGFEYTDARGTTVTLDTVPTTVVAQSSVAAALWDAGYHVAGVYGELTPGADGTLSYQAGDIDLSQVTVIGQTYGEFDVEDYGLMNPDLLVDYTFDGSSLWYVPAEQADQIYALAPSVAVPGNYTDTDSAIQTFVDLAAKLGADPDSAELASAKADYDGALKDVADVAASSGLKVVVVSAGTDSLYVADPAHLPELSTLRAAGPDLIDPVGGGSDVFSQYSWEQASDYSDADVILFDARTYDSMKADLANIPTWANLPAVKAGQVYPWYAAAPYSYQSYARIYQEIADELTAAKKLG